MDFPSLKKYVALLFLVLACACSDQNLPDPETEVIDLHDAFKTSRKVNLSEIASDIEYIQLESNEEVSVGRIEHLRFFRDQIILYDRKTKTIHWFDTDGKHLKSLNKHGRGPGEYTEVHWMEISPLDSTLYIMDVNIRRLIQYDHTGEHLNEYELPTNPSAFKIDTDGFIFLFFTYSNTAYNDHYSLRVFDRDMNFVQTFLRNKEMSLDEAYLLPSTGNFLFSEMDGSILVWEYGRQEVYEIQDQNTVSTKYRLKYPNPFTLDDWPDENPSKTKVFEIYETKYYVLLEGSAKEEYFRIYYDKRTGESVRLDKQFADKFNYGFINDMDGGGTFYPEGVSPDGRLYYQISLHRLKEYMDTESVRKRKVISEEQRTHLKTLLDNVNLEEDECIMMVRLKE